MQLVRPLIHVLGAGLWQVPTLRRARDMGLRVLVTDIYTERPGYTFCDSHEVIDIRDCERTLAAARRHAINGILCDTTDVGVTTAAFVAEQMDLPGIPVAIAERFTNKFLMRAETACQGLPNPGFRPVRTLTELHDAADRFGLPMMVKPPDSQSSRGVNRVLCRENLAAALDEALACTRGGFVLAEEFIAGIEVTVEAVCVSGVVHTLGISDKAHFPARPTVAYPLTYPAAFPRQILDRIAAVNAEVVVALGLRNGVTHAEYMVRGEEVLLVEIAARGGGSGIFSHIVPHLAGIMVPRALIEFAITGEFDCAPPCRLHERAAHLEFFQLPAGVVREIAGLDAARRLPGVKEVHLDFNVGDTIVPPDNDRARPGHMIILGDTRDEMLRTAEQVKETLKITVT